MKNHQPGDIVMRADGQIFLVMAVEPTTGMMRAFDSYLEPVVLNPIYVSRYVAL